MGGGELFLFKMWPGYHDDQIWWEFFLELTFVKPIQVCLCLIPNIWLPTWWCHVQLNAKKAWMLPAKATLWTMFSFAFFCACACVASQLVMLEHWALHEAVAFLNCGWWSVGTCSDHRRLLYWETSTFLPSEMFEMVWIVMGSLLSHLCIWVSLFGDVLEKDCQLEASWCCKSFMQSTSEDFCIILVCRCCVGMTNCSVLGFCSQRTC